MTPEQCELLARSIAYKSLTFCVQDIDIKSVLLIRCYRILKIKKVKIIEKVKMIKQYGT